MRRLGAAAMAALALPLAAQAPAEAPGRAKARACAPCHGVLGISVTPDAPHLAGQPRSYLVAQMRAFRSGQRRHEVMNVIAKPLTDADMAQIAEWFASLQLEAREPR